jgi:hypothetical membrane protein
MGSQYIPTVILGALIALFIIYRQLARRQVAARQLVVVPLVLALLGLYNLDNQPPSTSAAAVAIVASLASAVVFGLARGYTMRVWQEAGVVLRQGVPLTLVLWVVSIGIRAGIGVIAHRAGTAESVTVGELPLFLGVTLAAQNAVIWMRAEALGITPQIGRRRA